MILMAGPELWLMRLWTPPDAESIVNNNLMQTEFQR